MNSILLASLSACLLTVAWSLAPRAEAGASPATLLVKWKDGPGSSAAAAANLRIGAVVKRNFNAIGWQLVELPRTVDAVEGLNAYRALDGVLMVEPNGQVLRNAPPHLEPDRSRPEEQASSGRVGLMGGPAGGVTPNDPLFNQQWYLRIIGAGDAWATTTGDSNVVVAVLDSGINYNHQDLRTNMWRNPGETGLDAHGHDKATNGLDDDGDGYVDDVYGIDLLDHDSDPIPTDNYDGTECASIIGASGDDGKGMTGVNWRVSLMAIRMIGPDSTLAMLLEGHEYLLHMKNHGVNVRVANMSYGYGSRAPAALYDAHLALGNAGILQVVGAGNQGSNLDDWPQYPQSWRLAAMIIVGGSDRSDALWSSSNYGGNTVDLIAPATDITIATGPAPAAYSSSGYGNSFSGAQVVGAAALLLSAQPTLTVDELKAALLGSVDQPAAMKGKAVTNGRLNVARALAYLTNPNPAAIVVSASPRGAQTQAQALIQVAFNRPMDPATVESALVITPPVAGTFEWADDHRSFSFHHAAPFDTTAKYTARLLGTARDQEGKGLDGNYNQVPDGSPTDDYVWAFEFPLANDSFTDALVILGPAGTLNGDNRRASVADEHEPDILPVEWRTFSSSLWYRWTPSEGGGWCTLDLTSGTAFDSLLGVYVGNRLDELTLVSGNDNYGTRTASRVSFAAQPGIDYSVFLASKYNADPTQVGPFKLSWYPTPPPGFTGGQFSPLSGMPGARVTLTGTNFTGATAVLFNSASASFTNAPGNNLDLRITAVVPPDAASGPITVVTPHGSVTSTASFQVLPPPLSIARLADGLVEVRWPATSDSMVLETTDDLVGAAWQPVPELPRREGGQSIVGLPPLGQQFYRLKGE